MNDAESERLFQTYKEQLEAKKEDPVALEDVMEDVEEAYYMDAYIDATQYSLLTRMYANLTNDHSFV